MLAPTLSLPNTPKLITTSTLPVFVVSEPSSPSSAGRSRDDSRQKKLEETLKDMDSRNRAVPQPRFKRGHVRSKTTISLSSVEGAGTHPPLPTNLHPNLHMYRSSGGSNVHPVISLDF